MNWHKWKRRNDELEKRLKKLNVVGMQSLSTLIKINCQIKQLEWYDINENTED